MEDRAYEIWLTGVPGIGPKKISRILSAAGSARECFFLKEEALRGIYGITEKDIGSILESRKMRDPEAFYQSILEKKIRVLGQGDPDYPKSLLTITDPPFLLYVIGALPDPLKPAVAIVGARECTDYGRAMAKTAAEVLSGAGVSIISGMARGIDSAAHSGALRDGGETFAVLGNSPDICYPKSARSLYEDIIRSGGILSEYPPGTEPRANFFPIRNRIISALSDAVLVMEARKRSGALITADFALEQGKDVFALPGRITDRLSDGTNRLIRQGAFPILSMGELLKDLSVSGYRFAEKTAQSKITLAKEESVVYSCLDFVPKGLEELMEESGLSIGALSMALFSLGKRGLAEASFQNRYRRGY